MILEQAFLHLPEILHGSGYKQQDYEAGIVGAVSLSLLQVLNGHNTANPISCLQHERLFRKGGKYPGGSGPRYLRADLFLDIGKLMVANRRLEQYGWRHNVWLEAKFLRNQTGNGTKHAGNKSTHVANFLADIIRLSVLVPENKEKSAEGRYFVHVYDSDPSWYLTFRSRPWMKSLCQPGQHVLEIENLGAMPNTIKRILGDLSGLSLRLAVTNTVVKPLVTDNPPCYWMYLTRIDEVSVRLEDKYFVIKPNRDIEKSSPEALDEIAASIALSLHIDPKSVEAEPPVEPELEDEEITAEQDAPADG